MQPTKVEQDNSRKVDLKIKKMKEASKAHVGALERQKKKHRK